MKLIWTHCWHLTGYVPTCRIEEKQEWLQFQYERMLEVVQIANTYGADLIIGGDLFDQPRVDDEVITLFLRAMSILTGVVYIIGGNHSLPEHREANIDRSSLGIIKALSIGENSKIRYLVCDEYLIDGRFEHSYKFNDDITLVHTLSVDADEVPFAWKAITAKELGEKYNTPWVLVGDNHKHFIVSNGDQKIISAGCLIAESVNENDYEMGVYYIDTGVKIDVSTQNDSTPVYRVSKSTIEYILIHHNKDLVSIAHIKEAPTDEALQAMLEVLQKEGVDASIDYIRDLFDYIVKHEVSAGAIAMVENIRDSKETV